MDNYLVRIVYPGDPKGQARPRASIGGGHVRMYSPKSEWFNGLKMLAAQQPRITTTAPLTATIDCFFRHPQAHYRKVRGQAEPVLRDDAPLWCVGKPDVDNLAKSVLDALQQGGLFPDDKQVAAVLVRKAYAVSVPETVITLSLSRVEQLPKCPG